MKLLFHRIFDLRTREAADEIGFLFSPSKTNPGQWVPFYTLNILLHCLWVLSILTKFSLFAPLTVVCYKFSCTVLDAKTSSWTISISKYLIAVFHIESWSHRDDDRIVAVFFRKIQSSYINGFAGVPLHSQKGYFDSFFVVNNLCWIYMMKTILPSELNMKSGVFFYKGQIFLWPFCQWVVPTYQKLQEKTLNATSSIMTQNNRVTGTKFLIDPSWRKLLKLIWKTSGLQFSGYSSLKGYSTGEWEVKAIR